MDRNTGMDYGMGLWTADPVRYAWHGPVVLAYVYIVYGLRVLAG